MGDRGFAAESGVVAPWFAGGFARRDFRSWTALRTAVTGLAFIAAGSCAGTASTARETDGGVPSLAVARWVDSYMIGYPPCPPRHICPSVVSEVQLANVRSIGGRRLPRRMTVLLVHHGSPRRDLDLVFLVRRIEREWHAEWVSIVPRNDDACISQRWFSREGIPRPRHSWTSGEEVCFSTHPLKLAPR